MKDTSVLDQYLASLPLGSEFTFTMHPAGWNLVLIEDRDGKRRIAFRNPFPLLDDGYIRLVDDYPEEAQGESLWSGNDGSPTALKRL